MRWFRRDEYDRETELRDAADRYAESLKPGMRIVDATDGKAIAEFRRFLPAALIRLGMQAQQTSYGWLIVELRPPVGRPNRAPPLICTTCQGHWTACEHQGWIELTSGAAQGVRVNREAR